ncbi:hypothetical protein EST38_g3097 [Candolleomyces aberdarensis]|uniref:Uncharacterized protein n=1 Tax=Candolleomyces aberdarensis TaxID=2316362 RepID=A0A4Q2DSX3_9AGAR|nr:hypothetical protein EST38_g3097 [Candolleomyces aberdarensis]
MPKAGSKKQKSGPENVVECPHCKQTFAKQGFHNHHVKCQRQASTIQPVRSDYFASPSEDFDPFGVVQFGQQYGTPHNSGAHLGPFASPAVHHDPLATFDVPTQSAAIGSSPPLLSAVGSDLSVAEDCAGMTTSNWVEDVPAESAEHQLGRPPHLDDIKVVPHPHSGRQTRYYDYDDYTTDIAGSKFPKASPPSNQPSMPPWAPFSTRVDFKFAEMLQDAHLNARQIDAFISMVHEILACPEEFTLADGKHVAEIWTIATKMHGVGLEQEDVEVEYDGEDIKYPLWRVPARDWALSILTNPELSKELRFDAEQLFRHNGEYFVRFINEPWTANTWGDVQSKLPLGAAPFMIILYADKTKLSSMGTKKGYPVYVRCANLPSHIRNGEGLGGGQMIGWLPIIPEDADKSGKKRFVDFKRVVWHKALKKILQSLEAWAESGYFHEISEDLGRWLYPIILILSADFEEQCVMAAIRGMGSAYPCPVCLIPLEEFPGLSKKYPLRTSESMKKIYDDANNDRTVAEREALLKAVGLRNVENAFWSLKNTEAYSALSWDRLHAYHSGLFRKHILQEFFELLEEGGRSYTTRVEEHLFGPGDERGYQWLALARSYLELDMWASLIDHNEVTLRQGREELLRFEEERKKYFEIHPTKKWDFPKAHSHSHLFDDIENKGCTINFTTKFFEKMHGSLKIFFELSNFKDIEKQFARISHEELAALIIAQNILLYDREVQRMKDADLEIESADDEGQPSVGCQHTSTPTWIRAGSKLPTGPVCLQKLQDHVDPQYLLAFTQLRTKLNKRLTLDLQRRINIGLDDLVTVYRYLKVDYVSLEDSQLTTDFLRVNPNFHKHVRYDCALIQVDEATFVIGRLISVFGIRVEDQEMQYALVIPFDVPIPRNSASKVNRDRSTHLRFKQLRSRNAQDSVIVPLASIVRGALTVKDSGSLHNDQFVIVDVVDADFFLRMRLNNLAIS